MVSLYRRLLGPDFDRLPPSLQDFHDVTGEWQGRSVFRITRAPGVFRNLVAWLGRLPAAGEAVPMHLRIVADGPRERWIRRFGAHVLESVQAEWNGLMVESFGGITLGFRLVAEPPALRLEPARAWVLGIPWPRFLAPTGTGVEVGKEGGCDIVATAFAPFLGEIVRYEGFVERVR